jgi:hypothetical protein
MIVLLQSFATSVPGERLDFFASLTPTLSPRPFPPRRAGKGANSRIWPRLLTEDVQAVSPVASCQFVKRLASQQRSPTTAVLAGGQTACTSNLQSVGHIRLLAPLSAPAGVERGGGDRGGMKRQNCQRRRNTTKTKLNGNLAPMTRGENT